MMMIFCFMSVGFTLHFKCVSCFSLCCSSLPVPVCMCMCCHLVAYLLILQYVPYCSQCMGWLSDTFYLTKCCVPFQMTPLCSNVMMRIKVYFRLIVNVATVCVLFNLKVGFLSFNRLTQMPSVGQRLPALIYQIQPILLTSGSVLLRKWEAPSVYSSSTWSRPMKGWELKHLVDSRCAEKDSATILIVK